MKLFIDSSTNFLYLGLIKNDVEYTYVRNGKNDHSETLVDCLHQFLKDHDCVVSDVKEIYIGRGPGSYTGLRIAGTVGKVFAFATKIKLYSFSSLDLVLASKINADGFYISLIDAKKNHSYYKGVKIKDGELETVIDETFGPNEEIVAKDGYEVIYPTYEFFEQTKNLWTNLYNHKLYKEESSFDYTPNYIRSGI